MGVVADLVVRIRANTTELDKALAGVGKSWQRTGQQFQTIGANLTKSVTLPIVGLATVAIRSGLDFEKAMNKINGVMQPTSGQLDQIRKMALKMGADTVFSATDAATAMLELGKAGFSITESMSSVDEVMQLAAASGLSMGEAANMSARTLKAFGLETSDLAHVNDALTAAVLGTTLEIEDLQTAFSYVGPIAQGFGMSIEQVSAALGIMRDKGIAAETTGRALREGLDLLANPTSTVRGVMGDLGIKSFNDSNGQLLGLSQIIGLLESKGMTAAQSLKMFGQAAGPGMYALVKTGHQALDDFTDKLVHSEGAAKHMADAMMAGLPGAFEQLRGSVETAGISISKAMEPALVTVLNLLTGLANFVSTVLVPAFSNLPVSVQSTALAFVGAAAAAGPLAYAWGTLVSGASSVVGLLTRIPGVTYAVAAAQTALGGSIIGILGPLGAYIAAMALINQGTKSETFQKWATTSDSYAAGALRWTSGMLTRGSGFERLTEDQFTGARAGTTPAALPTMGPTVTPPAFDAHVIAAQQRKQQLDEQAIRLREDLTGVTAKNAAVEMMAALKGGQLAKTDVEGKKRINDVLSKGIDAYQRLGETAPRVMQEIEEATRPNIEYMADLGKQMQNIASIPDGMSDAFKKASEAVAPFLSEPMDLSSMSLTQSTSESIASDMERAEALQKVLKQIHDAAMETTRGIQAMGAAFVKLGQDIGGSGGSIVGGIGGIVQAFGAFKENGSPQGMMGKISAVANAAGAIWASTQAGGGGGSNALKGAAAGAQAGMAFGPYGAAVGAGVGALVGFVKSRMVSKDEKDARKEALAFQDELVSKFIVTASAGERAEAQGERWRMVNIAVRDAYLAVGKSEQQAMDDLARLNDATHVSAEAVQAAATAIGSTFDQYDEMMANWATGVSQFNQGFAQRVTGFTETLAFLKDRGTVLENARKAGKDVRSDTLEISKATDRAGRSFQMMGEYALIAFESTFEQTKSVTQAIEAVRGPLAELFQAKNTYGLASGGGAFDRLMELQGVVDTNKDVFDSLDGLNQMMMGLQTSTLLTSSDIEMFGRDASGLFADLTGRGVDTNTAMALMQPTLQSLWEQSQKFGTQFSPQTSALLASAASAGLIGEDHRPVMEQMLSVLEGIHGVLISRLPNPSTAAAATASGLAEGAASAVVAASAPTVSVTPSASATPTGGTAVRRVPAMASGGIVRRPTLAMIGEAGPEAVVPLSKMGGGLTIHFNGPVFDASEVRRQIAAWYHDAIETGGSSRTKARQLGLVG